MKSVIFLLVFFVLSSCAHRGKTIISEGDWYLKGGQFSSYEWKDSLKFERVSWYKELTLIYDVMYVRLTKTSPFYDWLSNSEKSTLAACKDSYVVLQYSFDNKKVSHGMFTESAKNSGFNKVSLTGFNSQLKLHAQYEADSLNLYKANAYCQKEAGPMGDKLTLVFPGFKNIILK